MKLDRDIYQGDVNEALDRVKFCLDHFEKIDDDACKIFSQRLGVRLTVEEIIGALVCAEQVLTEYKQEEMRQ